MSIPRMIATPKTTPWDAVDSPSTLSIWLRMVTKNAAIQVDVGLASPPGQRGAAEHDRGDRAEQVGPHRG